MGSEHKMHRLIILFDVTVLNDGYRQPETIPHSQTSLMGSLKTTQVYVIQYVKSDGCVARCFVVIEKPWTIKEIRKWAKSKL